LLSAPLIKRTSWYGRHEARGINTPGEVALHYALNIMSNAGVSFDLKMRVEGGHHVTEAVSKAQGVIIVCPHSLLTYVLIRYLHDIGQIPAVVSAAPLVPIYGTRTAVHALQPAADLFIRARTVLRRGGVICAMIDESPPDSVRTRQFTTLMGPMFVSDALIRLAKRCDAHLLFTCGRLDERQRLVLTFVTPAAGIAASEHDIAESFVDFIASH
jgi:lauroyl/myristoyl acyltransferase